MKIIKATSDQDTRDLRQTLEDELDEELCLEVVNLAFSEDGLFSKAVFSEANVFFDTIIDEEPKQVALMFFNGEDLDSRGPANPNRDYFRLNSKKNVESTDDPSEIYYDDLFDDIVDYIVEHIDDREFPEDIQDIIAEYQERSDFK